MAGVPCLSKTIDEHLRLSKCYSPASDVDEYRGIGNWGTKRIILTTFQFSLATDLLNTSSSSLTLIFLNFFIVCT